MYLDWTDARLSDCLIAGLPRGGGGKEEVKRVDCKFRSKDNFFKTKPPNILSLLARLGLPFHFATMDDKFHFKISGVYFSSGGL
jgi:hypothetical protein